MGMCQKRCPNCRKKRRFVDVHDLKQWNSPPIDPIKNQTKHDAGWRFINGQRICGYCAWRLKDFPMQETFEQKAKQYACTCHEHVNQKYDEHPYAYHLHFVRLAAEQFIKCEQNVDPHIIFASCWCHDLIEDARQTYNDVKNETNKDIAEIVYALTTEKGKNRAERAGNKYYEEMKKIPGAVFIKICDRIANMYYSKYVESSMFKKYCNEYPEFKKKLYYPEYKPMFDYIENLIISLPIE